MINRTITFTIDEKTARALRKITYSSISDKEMREKHCLSSEEVELVHEFNNSTCCLEDDGE